MSKKKELDLSKPLYGEQRLLKILKCFCAYRVLDDGNIYLGCQVDCKEHSPLAIRAQKLEALLLVDHYPARPEEPEVSELETANLKGDIMAKASLLGGWAGRYEDLKQRVIISYPTWTRDTKWLANQAFKIRKEAA